MNREIRFTDLIAKPFYPVHHSLRCDEHAEYWLGGGRGSLKSSTVSLEIIKGLWRNSEANALICRKVAETLRESVYAQIAWAIDMLGLTPWFKFGKSPLEITIKHTGQRILFRGADNPEKLKSLTLAKGYFKYLWFEEVTEFDGMDDISMIKATVIRGSSHHAVTLYSYNPPKSANNWVNTEVLKQDDRRLIHHSDYTKAPAEWLGDAFIAEAEALKKTNEMAYRHMYLGEVTGTGGQVFDNLSVCRIAKEERERFDRFYYGGDFGFTNDPDAFLKMYYDKKERVLYILEEVYGVRMNVDVLAEKVRAMAGRDYVTCDSQDPRMINELLRRSIRAIGAKKGPGSVEHGMRWLQDLGQIIIDPVTCPNAAREFSGYEYERDRHGNFISRYPDKDNHTIDSARYGVEALSTARKATIRNKEALGIY